MVKNHETDSNLPNSVESAKRIFQKRGAKIAAGTIGLLATAGVLSACGPDGEPITPSKSPTETSQPIETPSATPTAEPSPTPTETEKTISPEVQAELDTMKEMTWEEFQKETTPEQRALYVHTLYLDRINEEAELFNRYSLDEADLRPEVSKNNTYDEVINQSIADYRGGVIVANTDTYDEGMKILSATNADGKLPTSIVEWMDLYRTQPIPTMDGIVIAGAGLVERGDTPINPQQYTNNEGQQCWEADNSDSFCLLDFTDEHGQPAQVWVRQ